MLKLRFSTPAMILAVAASCCARATAFAQEGRGPNAVHSQQAEQQTEEKIGNALAKLSDADQKIAAAQRFCPVMTYDRLGSMGTPQKVMIDGKPVFVCCKACMEEAQNGGKATLRTVAKLRESSAELAKLPPEERRAIEAQKYCAVNTTGLLGSMGAPIKLSIQGKPVYLCCEGCTAKAQAEPAETLAKVEELKKAGIVEGHSSQHPDHKK